MPTQVRFDPYSISRELQLRVEHPFDPTNEALELGWITSTSGPEDVAATYELDVPEASWRQLRINLTATLPQSELEAILPEAGADDASLIVSVRCPSTKYRKSVILATDSVGKWAGELLIHRSQIQNVVELRPALLRTKAIPGASGPSGGTELGAVLAEGRPIRLVIDRSEPPISGALEITWEDFRESNQPWRKEHANDIQFLELAAGEPRLWLNSRYGKLKAALHSRQKAGVDVILKNMGNALLAQTAWLQLSITAIGSIRVDEETGDATAPEGWRNRVLEILAPRLLPETPEVDRLTELAERFRDPDRLPSLVSQVGSAVQEQLPTFKRLEDAIRAGERIDD